MTASIPALSRRRMVARAELAGSALCFGLMAILARKLTLPGMGFSAGHLAVLRFVVGALVSLLAFGLIPGLYRPNNYRLLVARGLSGGAVVVLYFYALAHIPAGEAGILYNVFPVIAVVMSLVLFKERPTIHLWLAILAASLGVVLVLSQGHLGLGLGRGALAALAAAIFAATSANAIRAARHTENAATIFFFFCVAGLPVVVPFALSPWPGGFEAWGLAILMSLLAFGGQMLMSEAYGTLAVSEAAVWLQLLPIVQYLLAVPMLGERATGAGLAGVLITVAGVAYGTVLGHRRRA
ncbi:DMT family transporter [Geothrix fuzhouensis]|uniref:DMT family transporter n=1 Tax=Geothrix fuzhouensis TaxID=2966451 RepID=UPI002148E479|nr:DMT family transporter [Geothrix fuzhouensis]